MRVLSVVGARPNFMKVSPIHTALSEIGVESRILHTGQHYDSQMSAVFFKQLGLPEPDAYLGVGSGTHAVQTARIMEAFDDKLSAFRPDGVVVVGDVNSTVACTLVAVKRGIPVAHVEAGLRSWDRSMPEEINRIVTDSISELLFVSEPSGMDNLKREGRPPHITHFVGNVMIDSLVRLRPHARGAQIREALGIDDDTYALVTIHRPANVDVFGPASEVQKLLLAVSEELRVVFPMHPRTRRNFEQFRLMEALTEHPAIQILEPLGYLEFLGLMEYASVVLTDSGGIQEETTFLGVPCLTIRDSTERPVTVEMGTNRLIPLSCDIALKWVSAVVKGEFRKSGRIPELWDGKASVRIGEKILQIWG